MKRVAAFVGGAATVSSLSGLSSEALSSRTSADEGKGQNVVAGSKGPIVETSHGKVVGYVRGDICTFKGIPYADTTAGAMRFMRPRAPQPWKGIRSSRQYGEVCPQAKRVGWAHDEEAFMFAWDDGVPGEDCLCLNLWTPGVNDSKKRPVMVWLHGGGFVAGSGQELRAYDGENLAHRGDVVVLSLNHRLGVFGFLDLSEFGARYEDSANAGMLDLVVALEWVRDNIASFGGDPDRVTLFGQSGGGGKVGALMGMPAAQGLFHRAIVQSGSMLRLGTKAMAQEISDQLVAELHLNAATIDQIQTLPYEQLVQAGSHVLSRRNAVAGVPNFRNLAQLLGFVPIVDGKTLPAHPFDLKASSFGSHVPMLIGSTLNEFVSAIDHPEYELMTEIELRQHVQGMFGDKAETIIAAFRKQRPYAKPFDLWSRISASTVRESAIRQARLQSAAGKAKAYLYLFSWQTPILDGRPRAYHCAELPFVFDNTDRCDTMTGGGCEARDLASKMADAWIQFARSGDPNHSTLPMWPAVSNDQINTMIFDRRVQMRVAPDAPEQASIA